MRLALVFVMALGIGCGGGSPDGDGGLPDGSIQDGSRVLRDAGCGPAAPMSAAPECVTNSCDGALICANGPCPEPCCLGGRLETCELPEGEGCTAAPPMDCGGGTCVSAGFPCP